jgi:hypothetical protein
VSQIVVHSRHLSTWCSPLGCLSFVRHRSFITSLARSSPELISWPLLRFRLSSYTKNNDSSSAVSSAFDFPPTRKIIIPRVPFHLPFFSSTSVQVPHLSTVASILPYAFASSISVTSLSRYDTRQYIHSSLNRFVHIILS